jgi:peroxiredoxin
VNWQLYRRWAAVAALAVVLVCCALPEQPYIKAEKDRKPAPDFSLKDAGGAIVKLSDYHGKIVLLNFWATWCGPCEEEIPWFIGFQQEFKDRDFAVLGISVDEDGWDAVKPFVARRKVNYRVMLGGEEVSQIYGNVENLPTTFIIDREGRIARTHIGLVSRNTYKQEILQLMGSPKQNDSYRSGMLNFPHGLLAFLRTR